MNTWDIWVKAFVLPAIESGRKDIEVRVRAGVFAQVRTGDELCFNEKRARRKVKSVRYFRNLKECLQAIPARRMMPDRSEAEILQYLQGVLGPKEHLGIVAFEMEPITKSSR